MQPRAKPTIFAVQGLRGLAALLVVADHSIATSVEKAGASAGLLPFAYGLGEIGVQIFFAVSGFVMMLSHGGDFAQAGKPAEFAVRRVTRIVPLYWLTTLIYWVKERLTGEDSPLALLLLSLAFIPHQEPGKPFGQPVYGLGWTLEYEMLFYAVFAVALFLRRGQGIALILLFFGTLTALGLAGMLRGNALLIFYSRPIVLYFLFGIAVGLARNAWVSRSQGWGFDGAVIATAVALVAGIGAMWVLPPGSVEFVVAQTIACCATMFACGLAAENAAPSLGKRIAKEIGDATYSIYLTHAFVVGPIGTISAKLHLPTALALIVALPVTIMVGVLCYRFVEKPMVSRASAWGKRLLAPG